MSTLKRLFEYTASATVAPVENFTTEALAAAIRSDWSPIVGVLGSHGIVTPDTVLKVEPFTQYHVTDGAGSGFVDLVLQIATTDGPHEVWLENKVGAPESGRQLAFYAAVIRQHEGDGVRRHLVVLSPRPISHAPNHAYIPWQEVGAAARAAPAAVWWTELNEYLEEIGMTEDATLPITASEAASLDAARRLFIKTRAIMRRANEEAVVSVPKWKDHWWPDSHITRHLIRQFVDKGRYTLTSGWGYPAFLVWGAVPQPDGVWFVVWVESEPKRTAARAELLRFADGRLAGWSRPQGRWAVLAAQRRALAFDTEDEAVGWFLDRLGELRDTGVLDLIPTLGKGPIVEEPSEGSEGAALDGDDFPLDEAEPPA